MPEAYLQHLPDSVFGHDSFRPYQEEIVAHLVAFSKLPGVGERKLGTYGAASLGVIRAADSCTQ